MRSVAVVGASLAGLSTARALRAQGYDGHLVMVGSERHRPYDRPPLSKGFLAGTVSQSELSLADPAEDLGVEELLGRAAVRLDVAERELTLSDGARLRPDGVVLATGAEPRRPAGLPAGPGLAYLRTVEDAVALRAELGAAERLVVVGGGFLGLEVAATARTRGLEVTVVEAGPEPLALALGAAMGAEIAALHADHGVRVIRGVPVDGLRGAPRAEGVALADGRWLPADLVVVCVGARPSVEWLRGSGLPIGDGVVCDAGGGTGAPGIVAVGDCSAWHDPRLGRPVRVEHWTAAVDRAPVAARTLLSGGPPPGPLAPSYVWSEQYDTYLQLAGQVEPGDEVRVEAGDLAAHRFLAVYRRAGEPVAVLGLNQIREFRRWRRQLAAARPQPDADR